MPYNAVVESAVNRAVVELSAVVVDDAGLVLMVRQGRALELPAGPLFAGETAEAGVARVVAWSTGVLVEVGDLVGVHSGREFGVCFRARPLTGELRARAEWVEPEEFAALPVPREARLRVEHVLAW
ncbi:NUDIX hydrolase [Actinokineospora sp. 24-640]